MRIPPQPPASRGPCAPAGSSSLAIKTMDFYGSRVDAVTFEQVIDLINSWCQERQGKTICFTCVSTVIHSNDSEVFREAQRGADLALPDGMPATWFIRRAGCPDQQRLCGPHMIFWICQEAAKRGIPVGFYGSTPETLDRIRDNLTGLYPDLDIKYLHSPPFRTLSDEEDAKVVDEINQSGARIVFVALGCPKQEIWVAKQRNRSQVVMLAIGGAFDAASGEQNLPPAWMQKTGLHWLYRLIMDPRRLSERYLTQNPRFLLMVIRHWFQGKKVSS